MLLIPPNYGLCLRIYHPNLNPDEITNSLGFRPDVSWMAGSQRKTPAGTLLESINTITYWCYSFESSDEIGPNEFLEKIFQKLLPNKIFFETIYSAGGHTEVYFTIRTCENAGETLQWTVLNNFVKLKMNLSIELFP